MDISELDDVGKDYLAMGVIEDASDVRACPVCRASVMPWYTRCEACGNTDMSERKETWSCSSCTEPYDTLEDAERCCMPRCGCCDEYFGTVEEAESCCSGA